MGSESSATPAAAADPYAVAAQYYDLGMRGFDEDEALYLGFAQRTRGCVLELGCGSGRLLSPLAGAGFSVTGVDRSAAMLALAHRRLAGAVTPPALVLASMAQLPLRGRFGLVFIALDSFLHLATSAEQRACLSLTRALLDRHGILLLDLPGPAAPGWEDWSPGVRPVVPAWSLHLPDGRQVTKLSTFAADASTQRHHVTEFYDCVAPDGRLSRDVVEYDLRFVFPAELELLLQTCGLQLIDRYGGYDLEPFTAGSLRQIAVAVPAGRR